ncbi:protransforming growth factor alpha isoform X2 [Betta splendens]|uniref:Protransforming growth factor alpha isoform X2 n=1 Tax=Betta splendens TaxID=158456 RepID=A0A6P7MP34_BETSP|nr:protransforming growth factor alpha isoform X2 [Betta splendens]
MTRIFWDTIFLISGSLFTFGAGPSNTTVTEAHVSINASASVGPDASARGLAAGAAALSPTSDAPMRNGSHVTFEPGRSHSTASDVSEAPRASGSASASSGETTTTGFPPVKKFVAAAVRSHFDDCPDSHRHFCFHGTCRFLILEETPACVCHSGFVGMRCEHADLLAVVAADHRQQTVATLLVLCVIGCVLVMVLCTLLHCWWRQDCRRRRHAHHHAQEKHGASCYPSESVV